MASTMRGPGAVVGNTEAPKKKTLLSRASPTIAKLLKLRLRRFWRVAMSARGKAPDAELRQVFMASARKSGLVTAVHAVSRHGEEDVQHVLDSALKGRDPWGTKDFSE
jgi:hypothetical protein